MKTYTEKFIDSHKILKKAIVGIEFEFFMKELSYYKTLEILNQYLSPIKVHGFRVYHPDFKPDKDNFILSPDLSGGNSLVELITSPLDYYSAKFYLVKIVKFIQDYGYTNEKCSVHFNISFEKNKDNDLDLNDLNMLKLILEIDEEEIYRYYPSRKDNVYAKSVKRMIPYKEYDFNSISIDVVKNNLRLPNDKYYGINFLNINNDRESQRLEFRYIGGQDYEKNVGNLLYFLDKFILNTFYCLNKPFTDTNMQDLENYLDKNISYFNTFSKFDNFIVEFPGIAIQIDQINDYDIINAYYPKLYTKLYNLLDSCQDLKNCIINYVTETQKIEIIDATIKSNFNIKNYDFINCNVQNGIFEECGFVNSELYNSQVIKCRLDGTKITGSKLLNCHMESYLVKDSFFMNGYINCEMESGVMRSGKLGPYANISSTTKIVSDADNFFDTKFDDSSIKKPKGIESKKLGL